VKRLVLALIIFVCLYLVINSVQLGIRIHKGMKLAKESMAFEVINPGSRKRILIIGDSTGVGTGASDPADSIAGRIAQEFPFVDIVNKSDDGAKAIDLLDQFSAVDDRAFDVVLVQVGGNDILRFTDLDDLKNSISEVLREAYRHAPYVIFMSTGNVGSAPAFFPPVNRIYTERTRKVRSIFLLLSREKKVEYVDLFAERKDDPFLREPERFFAPDFLHPGSDGYGLWYEELKQQTSLKERLSS